MQNEFVTYEQALALKELGFDWGTYEHYDSHTKEICDIFKDVSAPLKQQIFRWFREKHNILHTSVFPLKITASDKEGYRYSWEIIINEQEEWVVDESPLGYYTYEEAENAAIDKLIEIAKQQGK